ncbi:MAG TPA: hypothetical protein VGI99_12050 [Gemmataceae bacterium]|jgi:hypothetical protein
MKASAPPNGLYCQRCHGTRFRTLSRHRQLPGLRTTYKRCTRPGCEGRIIVHESQVFENVCRQAAKAPESPL